MQTEPVMDSKSQYLEEDGESFSKEKKSWAF